MMSCRYLLIYLLFVPLILTADVYADPLCAPPGSAPELLDNPSHGWLTPLDADETKAYILQFAPKESRWEGETLIVRCEMQGSEPSDMTAAYVKSAGQDNSNLSFSREYFADLARRTGHTPEDADRLYHQYTNLQGAYFKQVPDGKGGFVRESDAIFDRYKGDAPAMPATPSTADKQSKQRQAVALKEKILAAQARGDMQEMMRLAAEAQRMTSPEMQQADQINNSAAETQWRMLESAYPALVQAVFRTRITPAYSTCLGCSWID